MLLQWGAGTEQAQAQFCRVCTFHSLCNLWPSMGRHWKSRRSSIDHRGSLPPAQLMGFSVTTCVFSTEWLQLPEGTSPFLLSQTFGLVGLCVVAPLMPQAVLLHGKLYPFFSQLCS